MANFTQLTDDLGIIAALADLPNETDGLTATQLKAKFDEAGETIQDFINDNLIAELEAQGASSKIGAVVGGASGKLQDFIDAVEAAGSGSLPPSGTVTNVMMATDVKIGSLASLTTTAKDSLVNAINELKSTIAGVTHTIPAGLIAQWSGLITAIPSGWVLCDGNNGTPNLADKFVMGTTSQGTMNTTGGSNTKSLTTNELPTHTHTGTTASDGAHNHTTSLFVAGGSTLTTIFDTRSPIAATTSTITSSTNGAHAHTVTINNSGSGASFDIRPSFYQMAYIMKT